MQFLPQDVGARLVAVAVGAFCARELWQGLARGRINSSPNDVFDLLLNIEFESRRDATPIRYWTEIFLKTVGLLACMFVAVFG